jgi:RimJ/RimL family protein N-acetyltransferase
MEYQVKGVVFELREEWMSEAGDLVAELRQCGIECSFPEEYRDADADDTADWSTDQSTNQKNRRDELAFNRQAVVSAKFRNQVVLTDDPQRAAALARLGIVCIGCQKELDRYFDGVELVVFSLADLDARIIEETFCHGRGLPMTITQTERLVIREIAEEDFAFLEQLGQSEGMQLAVEKEEGMDGPLDAKRLTAYIRHVYRLYGYGLWMVLGRNETRIGLCGLTDWDAEEIDLDSSLLQLQYAVAPAFRRQGYAFEMCRAVLEYAMEQMPERKDLWLRIHTENAPSLHLAEKLGFQYRRTIGTQKIFHYKL